MRRFFIILIKDIGPLFAQKCWTIVTNAWKKGRNQSTLAIRCQPNFDSYKFIKYFLYIEFQTGEVHVGLPDLDSHAFLLTLQEYPQM